ncbi:hypothetical protein QR680_009194 [Steinernema hermaphroditum]|uniref:PDZ domain-containing protein n=1 Tax=Steinernema hermaphroditum TaxID=289476 RepID=A0AA39IKT1_9BILA|nr:hypothetical protein QR680_009194 [Steinernema hermaphroditum]
MGNKREASSSSRKKRRGRDATLSSASGESVDDTDGIPLEPPTKILDAELVPDVGENIGLRLTPNLVVESVAPLSVAYGKLLHGDTVVTLNGTQVISVDHFLQLVAQPPPLLVTFSRPICKTSCPPARLKKLGLTRSRLEGVYKGDDFFVAHVIYRPGMRLGFALRSALGRVVVASVAPDGIGANRFECGDLLLEIDGVPVDTKTLAKSLMLTALEGRGHCSVVTQSPRNARSLEFSRTVLGSSPNDPIDPPLPVDATLIGRRQMERHRNDMTMTPPPGILLSAPILPTANVTIAPKHKETKIESEYSSGTLLTTCISKVFRIGSRMRAIFHRNRP